MIQTKLLKKVLAAALAMSLVMAPAITAGATDDTPEPGSSVEETVTGTASDTSVSAVEAAAVPTTSTVTVDGKTLTSAVSGAYLSRQIPGTVIETGSAVISEGYGLTGAEKPYVRVYDITAKGSPAAYASINAAAAAVGGSVVSSVNMEIGKLLGRNFSLLPQTGAPIIAAFGIPKKSIAAGYAYAVICVRPGGAIEIMPDLDDDPATVTFSTTGGLGAYSIVMYPVA